MPRKDYGRELWESLVDSVKLDDGLPVFKSKGYWTAKKLFFVCQYLEQTTRGMKNKRAKFAGGLNYIDLFCGDGISVVESDKEPPRRFPGSPLIAASMPEPFDRLILVDKNQDAIDTLRQRLPRTGFAGKVFILPGDCNVIVDEVCSAVPPDALNMTFVDPYSLDVHFETIRRLAERRAMDLIVLFSDRFDLGRNVHKYYYPTEEQSKLDRFLGVADWKERLDGVDDQSGMKVRGFFAEAYREKLKSIGYNHTKHWPLDGPSGPAFRIFFASKAPLGLKFCEIALRQDLGGDLQLFRPHG